MGPLPFPSLILIVMWGVAFPCIQVRGNLSLEEGGHFLKSSVRLISNRYEARQPWLHMFERSNSSVAVVEPYGQSVGLDNWQQNKLNMICQCFTHNQCLDFALRA